MSCRRLESKAILVTGAAAGIGRATARRLASEGASVALADRDLEGLRTLAAELADAAQPAFIVEFDAADARSTVDMVENAVASLGRLDAVCNVAGIFSKAHFTEVKSEDWDRVIQINLTSVFHISQRAIPHLLETGGSIVNTASIVGLGGMPYGAAYAVSKAGLIALTKSLAIEYAAAGLRVNVICPGGVRTSMGGSAALPASNPDLAVRRTRLPGFDGLGEPGDIAAAFAYLVSEDARYVSGAVLSVDGAQQLM
jgi:NAD(P)-dependent dehydrogenase (short-subunit alcohol dehydrogenase family)